MIGPLYGISQEAATFATLGTSGTPIMGMTEQQLLQQILVAVANRSGGGGGGGSGTVTNVSVVTANGVSGSVANATTTPAITLTLGDITPISVNGLTLAAQATGFTIAGGTSSRTLTVLNTGTAAVLGFANVFTAAQSISVNGAASTPPLSLTGTWFTGGSATTTKPQLLIEPTGSTSTNWSTDGTGLGVNAASGFVGNLIDAQVNASARFRVSNIGSLTLGASGISNGVLIQIIGSDRSCTMGLSAFGSGLAVIGSTFDIQSSGATMRFVDGAVSTRYGSIVGIATDVLGVVGLSGAQKLSVYGSTDTTNYVRASLTAGASSITLSAERAGSASADISVNILKAGTGNIILSALPTSDPGVSGALYKDVSGIVIQSP